MTVVVPQLRRGDNSLHLWNTARSNPVHQFVGHQDVILEFQWRKQPEGKKEWVKQVQSMKDKNVKNVRFRAILNHVHNQNKGFETFS